MLQFETLPELMKEDGCESVFVDEIGTLKLVKLRSSDPASNKAIPAVILDTHLAMAWYNCSSFPRSRVGMRTLLTTAAKLRKAPCMEISICFSIVLKFFWYA